MTTISWLKTASTGLMVALLAACGGGGGASSTPAPEVPWASPAVFVTPGASSKSFALTGCTKETYVNGYHYPNNTYTPFNSTTVADLSTATLVIESNGDLSLKAATAATGTAGVQWNGVFADFSSVGWSVEGTTQSPTYTLNGYVNIRNSDKNFEIYSGVGSEESSLRMRISSYESVPNSYTSTQVTYECNISDKLALQVNADQARAAKNLGTGAGVTTFDDYEAIGRIEGGKAFWQNYADEYAAPQYAHLSFDLTTGALASSASGTGTYTAVSLALPSSANSYGAYSESLQRGNSFFSYKDAKSICLTYVPNIDMEVPSGISGTGLFMRATAYGTRFMPYGGRRNQMGSSFEAPQASISSQNCNNYFD